MQAERSGDYYRLLTEYHEERLRISRKINYRQGESDALISCGQTQSIYLGDYAAGLALLNEGQRIRDSIVGRSFGIHAELAVLLRIVQVFAMQAKYGEALEALEAVHRVDEQEAHPIVRAGRHLVTAILYNSLGDEEHLRQALGLAARVGRMVDDNQVSRQFAIAAACESAAAHLHLAELLTEQEERPVDAYGQPETQSQHHLHQALECSQDALDIYQSFGFVQIIECVSEEILFRHSLALNANGREAEAAEYLQRAYDEMMRKHDLIPPDSHCRHTFLENIPLHRHIRAAYAAMSA